MSKEIDNLDKLLCYHIRLSEEKDKEIEELKIENEKLKKELSTAIRFETPRIKRFAVVIYYCQKNEPLKIIECFDNYKDKDKNIVHYYEYVKSSNFKLIKICDTKQEAEQIIKELLYGGERK